jgi:glycosyltransferase involved in cell wall biosynthesis
MRIGLIVPGFSAHSADWCIPALRHLARALATRDDVRVIAVRYPYRTGRAEIDGAEVIAVGGAQRRGAATLDVWRRTLDVLAREHRHWPFDVLHAFWATESGLLAAMGGRILRIPTLVSLAGGELVALPDIAYGDQLVAWERLKIRATLRLAAAVSAGSQHMLALAEPHVRGSKLHRAPLGVDTGLFTPAPGVASKPSARFVHVGSLTHVKDQAMLLHAFAAVRQAEPHARLDIVGGGPLQATLQHLACALGVADAVRLVSEVDHAALPSVYQSGSAFVLSSRHEAQGMVAVEAAACGLPIAGTCVGVIPELAAPDAVVPVGDAAALARSMLLTLSGGAAHAATARDQARTAFSLDQCTARFRDVYASLTDA